MSRIVITLRGHVYDDLVRLLLLYSHRETSILVGELHEESDQFHFLRDSHLVNLKDYRIDFDQGFSHEGCYSHYFGLSFLSLASSIL